MTPAGYIVLQAIVPVAIFLYCLMIYGFRFQAAASLKSIAQLSSKKEKREEWGGIDNKRLYDRFTAFAAVIGVVSVGIAAGKIATTADFDVQNAVVAEWLPVIAFAVAGLAAVCVVRLEILVLKAAGRLTLTDSLTDTVVGLKKTYIAVMALLVAPAVFMYTGVNPVRDEIFMYVAVIELIAIAVMYAVHTLNLFVKQKVSLLVWFLYLCTVEIFPISLVVLLVVKNV